MADVNANISVNIDTSAALAELKNLQRQISNFHNSIAKSSASAAIAQRNLQQGFVDSINATGQFAARIQTIRTSAESFTNSLEKNKFSMREYFRYGVASTKMFGKTFRTEFDTINKVAIERTRKLQTQYIKMGRDANGAMQAIAVTPLALDMDNLATKTMVAAQRQQLFNQLLKQGSTNLINFGKNTQWAGRQLMVGFTLPLSVFGSTASKVFMDLEIEMIRFKRVYGDLFTMDAEMQANLDTVKSLAAEFTKFGVTVQETLATAADAAAAGFSGKQLEATVRQATRLAVLGEVDRQEAFKATIALQTAFQLNTNELADSINFLNAVENQSVVSLQNLTDAIPRVAPIIRGLGGDVKDLSVFLAAMQEGGVNAAEAANGLKSALASIINPTKQSRDMLAGAGIDIKNIVDKNAGNLMRTILELGDALKTLTPLARQRILEQLFGKFQFARVSALFDNIAKEGSQAQRTMELMQMSAQDLAQLANKELAAIEENTATKFKAAVEEIRAAIAPVGELFLQIVTPVIKTITQLIERFNNLSDNSKKVIGTIIAVLGGVAPVVLMLVGLFANFAGNLMKFFGLIRNGYLKLTGQSKYLGEQTQYLTEEQMQAEAVASSLDQVHARLTQRFTSETEALMALTQAYRQASQAARNFSINNPGMMLPQGPTRKYNSGAKIVPGSGNRDTVPAMLTPGESVIPKKQTKKYGGLINGIIADNIPGFREGLPSIYGGQQRILGPYTMFAPGNTPGGFGMSKDFLGAEGFGQSLRNTAIAAGSIEANIRLTDKVIQDMAVEVSPFTDQITNQLRIAAQEMQDTGQAARHINELFERKRQEISNILSELSATGQRGAGMAEGLRKFAYATDEDILTGGNVRTPGVVVDPTTGSVVRSTQYSKRTGRAASFQDKIERVTSQLPISSESKMSRAHVLPESRVLLGGMAPLAGAGMALPEGLRTQAVAEIERRSALVAEKAALAAVSGAARGAGTASPSKKTIPIGEDIANGLIVGMNNKQNAVRDAAMRLADESVTESGLIVPGSAIGGGQNRNPEFLGMPGMPQKKSFGQRISGKYSALSDRMSNARTNMAPMIGKLNMATMAITSVGIAASMVPGPLGQMTQNLMPLIMGIQGLAMALPMLMTPMGAAVGIVAAVATGFYLVNKAQKDYIKNIKENAEKEAKVRQGSADSIQSYSEFLGEGGTPSQRQFNLKGEQRFISAENAKLAKFREYYEGVGKDSAQLIKFAATKGSAEALAASAQDIANRVKVFGLDPKDIAANIKAAAELAGVSEIDLKSKLQQLLAPNGDDILKTPLTIQARINLLTEGTKQSVSEIISEIDKVTGAKAPGILRRALAAGQLGALFAPGTAAAQQKFAKDQLRQASISNALTLSFEQQKQAIALLNAQYVDGAIDADEYKVQHDALISTFQNLGAGLSDFAEKAPDAYKGVIDSIFKPLVEGNKKLGNDVRKEFDKLSTDLQAEIVVGIGAGGLNLTDIKELSLIMAGWENKTIDQKIKILAEIPSTSSDIVKKFIELRIALEKEAEAKIAADKIESAWKTGSTIFTIEQAYATANYNEAVKRTKKLQKELAKLYKAQKDSPQVDGNTNIDEESDSGKDPYAFLEPLLSRLKQVRKESINAAGGVEYFVKLLSKDMKGFKGMDQMLRAAGATQGFIDIVNGLDSDQLKLFGDRLYKIKDGEIVFGDLGKAIQRFTKEVELGNFNDQLQQSVVNADNQYKAYTKLRAAGLSASQALELTADNALAAAIAAEKVDSQDFKNFISGAKKGEQATKDLAKALKGARFEAEQEAETEADKVDDFFAYEEARIKLEKYRQFVEKQGMSPADFERNRIKPAEKAVEAAQDQVDVIEKQIDAEQDLIDQYNRGIELIGREEDKINEEYDKRNDAIDQQIEALDKVQKLNQDIVDQQKRATTLADALSTGDIAAAAQIAQEMRGAAASTAIENQKAALEERKNQLELERNAKINALQVMINEKLYTRDQLEAMILEKEDKIYEIQNTTLKDAQALVDTKQQELDKLNEILTTYEEDLATALANIKTESGLTKDEWNLIKDAVNATNDYFDTMITDIDAIAAGTLSIASAWDAVTAAITNANNAKNNFNGSGNNNGNNGGNNDGSKVVLVTSSGKEFTADQVKDQIATLTEIKSEAGSGTYAGFKAKEQIDELNYILQNPKVDTLIVDERTKIAGAKASLEAAKSKIGGGSGGGKYNMLFESRGGFIQPKYLAAGGLARGSDKIPAMLTPGEFVMNKYAVSSYGLERMKALNSGTYNGDNMYNYNLTVNVKSDANPNDIANTVMTQLRQIESKRLRGGRL